MSNAGSQTAMHCASVGPAAPPPPVRLVPPPEDSTASIGANAAGVGAVSAGGAAGAAAGKGGGVTAGTVEESVVTVELANPPPHVASVAAVQGWAAVALDVDVGFVVVVWAGTAAVFCMPGWVATIALP